MRGPGVLLLLALTAGAALGEALAGGNFKVEVAATVAGAAAGASFQVCAGAGCMAVPVPAAPPPPGNPGNAGGGGGGGGGAAPPPALVAAPEPTPSPPREEPGPPAPGIAPEPPAGEPGILPPLPRPEPESGPAPGPALPWPAAAVAVAATLAALLLVRGAAGRTPAAGAEEVAVAPRTEVIGGNCPFCGDLIKGSGLVSICPSCRAVHHSECWGANAGCTTLGCSRAPARPGAGEAAE
ncbi:MAG: RING finger protein [Halobacteria archaeon]